MKAKNLLSLLFFFALFVLTNIDAQNTTWTGNTNNDWGIASNWTNGIPTSGSTVNIRPQSANPYPVLSQNTTIKRLNLSQYSSGGDLTITSSANLTITDQFDINNQGRLFIESSAGIIIEDKFNMGYTDALIDIETGSFTAEKKVQINGTFNAGAGSVTFEDDFTLANNKVFNTEDATVIFNGKNEINGTYNGDDGISTFNDDLLVKSGGIINLGSGTINTNSKTDIESNGTANFGSGTVNISEDLDAKNGAFVNIQNATVNISGEIEFKSDGNLSIDSGTLNITGDATLKNGGSFDLNSGNLNIGGDAEFTNGGTVNAGSSNITVKGDFKTSELSNFNADSSTVRFNGEDQAVDGDVIFYNVVVDSGSTVSSKGNITVENDLTVEEDGALDIQGDDQLDVQGEYNNDGTVNNTLPFIEVVRTVSLNSLEVEFDTDMESTSAENISNYTINNGITISNVALKAGDPSIVVLTVSTLTNGVEYLLTVNNVQDTEGNQISNNHRKRFTPNTQVIYYSRINGNWNVAATWSTQSHTGTTASAPPTGNSVVIIGNSDVVSITSLVTASDFESIEVDLNSQLQVSDSGIFEIENEILIGDGTFSVTNGELRIGSAAGITSSGAFGNIQTDFRSFSTSGSYTYNGSVSQNTGNGLPNMVTNFTIDNSSDVAADNNLRVSGTLTLIDGSLIIPSGQNLIANTKTVTNGTLTFRRTITGNLGWRQLSSPVNSTYADLLDSIVTQGYAGSSLGNAPEDSLQPNILFYIESYPGTDDQRYRTPTNASNIIPAGQGIYSFVFGDIASDSRYNIPLPSTLEVEGQENEGSGSEIDFGVTYTANADTGWNFIGNPYGTTIDWDDNGWTKTNIDNTIYVWDPSVNQYLSWNGTTGSLSDGLIAPFQGFWIKANAASPSLIIDEDAKTFGNTFVGKANLKQNTGIPEIEIKISKGQNSASTFFQFSEQASVGKDQNDAFNLLPPLGVGTFLNICSISRNGNAFSINNLPRKFGKAIEIPIQIEAFENGFTDSGTFTITSPTIKNIPLGWKLTLIDNETGRRTILSLRNSYSFQISGPRKKAPGYSSNESDIGLPRIAGSVNTSSTTKSKSKSDPRFKLLIDPGSDASDLPSSFELKQNFPNPFNPATNIKFTLPVQSSVTLEIYDILGRRITTLVSEELSAGEHIYQWDASRQASGVYLYRLVTSEGNYFKKMTLLK